MATFENVLGSILRDIGEARVSSDIYARDASFAYQKDPVLRRFPVPRVDISDLEVDLKFSISGIKKSNEIDNEDPEINSIKINQIVNRNFERFGEELAEKNIDLFYRQVNTAVDSQLQSSENPNGERIKELWHALDAKLNSKNFRERIRLSILDYFTEHKENLVTDGFIFNYKDALEPVENIFKVQIYDDELFSELKNFLTNLSYAERIRFNIDNLLKEMRNTILWIGKAGANYELIVETSAERLQNKDKDTVSSLKFSAAIKNYVWTQIEEKDGKVIRQLIPE